MVMHYGGYNAFGDMLATKDHLLDITALLTKNTKYLTK